MGIATPSTSRSLVNLKTRVGALLEPGDLFLSLGAGNVHEVAAELVRISVLLEEIQAELGNEGTAKLYEPLSKHTTLRVGGPARFWIEPSTEAAFARLVEARSSSMTWKSSSWGAARISWCETEASTGWSSIPTGANLPRVEVSAETFEITAGAAVGLKRLCGAAAKAGIGGFEWMEGIPGSVGGSLRMNAGAMGIETFDQVVRVRVVDATGEIHELTPAQMEIHYREVPTLKKSYALSATFRGHRKQRRRDSESCSKNLR